VWIERTSSGRLLAAARQFPAVVLTGARQTGKTALLRHVFPNASFIPLDLPSNSEAAEQDPQRFLGGFPEPVILDEVQYAPALLRYLKVRIDADRHRMGRFLMTGSQSFPLMNSVSESLAGRCAVIPLPTLSSAEVLRANKGELEVGDFLFRGGFPELHRDPGVNGLEFFSSYVATYLERDVRSVLRVGSLRDFERFIRACAMRSGGLLNFTDLARDVGIAGTTAKDWLSVLEASGLVVLLEPYFGNVSKRLIRAPKLYLTDTGLMCFLCGVSSPDTLVRSMFIGPVWETFVLGQILRAKAATISPASVYFWRDAHGTEVDFVIAKEGRLRLVEAKWTENLPKRPLPSGAPWPGARTSKAAGGRQLGPLLKVAAEIKGQTADEHWVACRPARSYRVSDEPMVRLIDAFRFEQWC